MVGLKRGNMAELCFRRAVLLDPLATGIDKAFRDAQATKEGRADKQVMQLLEVPRVNVSACILTRDSSRTIRQCIEALQSAVDEIVVVDTGSKDDTVRIVKSLGVNVHHFQWIDDFAAARNYAQSLATSDWVIAIDSDEILLAEDADNIRLACALFNDVGMALEGIQFNVVSGNVIDHVNIVRLHQKSIGFTWSHPIHEYLVTPEGEGNRRLPTHRIQIRVLHGGYDPAIVEQTPKIQRNLQLIARVVAEQPHNALYLYYMGRELYRLGKHEEALPYIERAAQYADDRLEARDDIYRLLKIFNNSPHSM